MSTCRVCGAQALRMINGPWWVDGAWVRADYCGGSFGPDGAWSSSPCEAAQAASQKAGKAAARRPRQPRQRVAYGDYGMLCAFVNGQRGTR